MVHVNKEYVFDAEEGQRTLGDLFARRSQLLVYHFMYGPTWTEGCPFCSLMAIASTEPSSTSTPRRNDAVHIPRAAC